MKLFILLLVVGAVVGRPSFGPIISYSHDGRGFSYSYNTPFVHAYAQPAPFIVGPSVKYSYATVPVGVKHIEPANIQISADGFVLDTPEVANARAEHLAAVAQEAAKADASSQSEFEPIIVPDSETIEVPAAPFIKSTAAFEPANIQVSADGHVLDTPEVAQAKAEHLARFAAEAAKSSHSTVYHPQNVISYTLLQPSVKHVEFADVKVSADGHVLDTPEVAQAKAEHFAQYASESARAIAAGDDEQVYDDGSYNQLDEGGAIAVAPVVAANKVDDPPADIKVSADGFVLDTPEVAQAKAEHLAELAKAGPDDSQSDDEGSDGANAFVAYTSPTVAYTAQPVAYVQPKYFGPEANIQVGPHGFLEDTPEVKQAREEHLSTRNSIASRYAAYVVPSQYIADTPEVASAKAAHFKAHAEETIKAKAGNLNYGQLVYSAPVFHSVVPNYGYSFASPYKFLSFRYAPTAAPVALTPDGQYLLDTPEVAAEKVKHFAVHASARRY